ncbi:MAG: YicC/YloC family endoribonuclease [Gemmatimonadota bacterium]|jgi:uncharacterized protein (TIGR00255 family)
MIRSMTGFGEASSDIPAGRIRAEIRTVNHRFFSVNLRLGRGFERLEPPLREWLREHFSRGHVNCSLQLERDGPAVPEGTLEVDLARARRYAEALRGLQSELGLGGEVDVALIARFGDVLSWSAEGPEPEIDGEAVRAAVEAAARATVTMREEEGRRLAVDLDARLAAIEVAIGAVEARAPERLVQERDRMRRVVAELLDGATLDEDRVAREIAMLAERWDVSEETVRLRAHVAAFREAMASAEPVGKRLGFLGQEMNREANTIGSKANDAALEHHVIAIKEEIERLREQIENVE